MINIAKLFLAQGVVNAIAQNEGQSGSIPAKFYLSLISLVRPAWKLVRILNHSSFLFCALQPRIELGCIFSGKCYLASSMRADRLWVSACGSQPVGRSLWVSACGSQSVGLSQWVSACGSQPVGLSLWIAACGSQPVGRSLWVSTNGSLPWVSASGSHPVGHSLWVSACGSQPVS